MKIPYFILYREALKRQRELESEQSVLRMQITKLERLIQSNKETNQTALLECRKEELYKQIRQQNKHLREENKRLRQTNSELITKLVKYNGLD